MYEHSLTDRYGALLFNRLFLWVERRRRRANLIREVSTPRGRPLDRRLEHPTMFEDKHMRGCVTFAEHEDGLSIVASVYGQDPKLTVELDNWTARMLWRYLKGKVEGEPYETDGMCCCRSKRDHAPEQVR